MLIYINQIEMSMGGRKLKNPANKGTWTQNLCPTKSLFCLLVFGLITSIWFVGVTETHLKHTWGFWGGKLKENFRISVFPIRKRLVVHVKQKLVLNEFCSPLLVRICTCMMHWRAQLFKKFECKKTISSLNELNSERFPFHSLMFVFCIENIINGITSRETVKPTMTSNPSPPVERGKSLLGSSGVSQLPQRQEGSMVL